MMQQPGQPSATHTERLALECKFNLSDGHARQALTLAQAVARMPAFYHRASLERYGVLVNEFLSAQFDFAGQVHQMFDPTPELHYSASESIEIAAKVLKALGKIRVGLIHPTFDNLADLTRRQGLALTPVAAETLWSADRLERSLGNVDAVFVVMPNNPTAHEPTAEQFENLLRACAATGVLVVADFSFRAHSRGLQKWDQYTMASSIDGLDAMFIEDTGKTWPTHELKVGTLSASRRIKPLVRHISEELVLSVSPITLQLLERFIAADLAIEKAGDISPFRTTISGNRSTLRQHLRATPLRVPFLRSTLPVEWLQLPAGWSAKELTSRLAANGVGVLDGGPFFWNDPAYGDRYLRVALARTPATFSDAAPSLASGISSYEMSLNQQLTGVDFRPADGRGLPT